MPSRLDKFNFSLDGEEFDLLLMMAGIATGVALRDGDREKLSRFRHLANKLNEQNPDWTPYIEQGMANVLSLDKIDRRG